MARHRQILEQPFYPFPLKPVAFDSPLETPHRPPQPQTCPPLCVERWEWTPEQFRLAAAVLWSEAVGLLRVIRDCPQHPQAANDEAARIATQLARTAWSYAKQVLAAEAVDVGTFGGVRR